MTIKFYKIIDIGDKGELKTLFHGLNGSRVLPMGEWLESETKLVKDGTSKTEYLSGWHITKTFKEAIDYLEAFKNLDRKAIVECYADEIRPKKHSRSNIFLSKWLKINKVVWRYNEEI